MPFADEGIDYMLDASFRQATQETKLWFGLANHTFLVTSVLTDILGEPALANGYARIEMDCNGTDFPTLAVSSPLPGYELTSTAQLWTAAGGAIPVGSVVNSIFVATTVDNTGLLIGWRNLPSPVQIKDGNSLEVTKLFKLISV